jgi:hypothetical protein
MLGNGMEKAKDFLRENPSVADELVAKILQKRGVAGTVLAIDTGEEGDDGEDAAPAPAPAAKAKKGRQAASSDS